MKNLKVTTKVFSGFGFMLALLILISAVGSWSLFTGNADFVRYRAIALQTNQAGRVQANLLETRIAVKNFVIDGSEASIAAVKDRANATIDFNSELHSMIEVPENRALVEKAAGELKRYVAAFADVVALQEKRNDLVFNGVDKIGPGIERKLTQILDNARGDANAEASYLTATTLRSLLLMRLYVTKFLLNNDTAAFDRVNAELADLAANSERLMSSLTNPDSRKLAEETMAEIGKYKDTFSAAHDTINARNDIIKGTLDTIGPTVADEMESLKLAIKAEQDRLGPEATAAMERAVVITFIVAGAAIVLGLLAAWLIGTGLSRPIIAMTGAMGTLAEGDLEVEIPGAGRKDEVGAMASAVQVFKENAIEVRRLEAERVENERRAEEQKRADMMKLADAFEAAVSGVVNSVSAAAAEMQSSSESMSGTAEQTSMQATTVASAAEQATGNVQTVATAAEELTRFDPGNQSSSRASLTNRRQGGKRGGKDHGNRGRAFRGGSEDRRGRQPDQRYRRADQPPRLECHDRGGPRRRRR